MTALPLVTTASAPRNQISDAALEFQVFEDLAATGIPQAQWDEFVQSHRGDIYFSWEWLRTWWDFYGKGRIRRILVFRAGGRLVGVVPLMIFRVWVGPVPVRVARLLGADSTIVVLNPPVVADFAAEIYAQAIEHALLQERCDVISLAPLSGEGRAGVYARAAAERLGSHARLLRAESIGVHSVFHLPPTGDAYLASLSKSERGNYRRDERRLQELYSLDFRSLGALGQLETEFDRFVELHHVQWRMAGKLGHFGDWPRSAGFAKALLRRLAPTGGANMDVFYASEQAVVYEFDFVFGDTHYWRLTSRVVNEEVEKRGIGRVTFVRRALAMISRGIRRIEGGPGHYDYKLRLGATEYPLESVVVAANRPLSLAKSRLLLAWSDWLNLAYYRVWFQRIAPRLPQFLRRPLWKSWIRSRL
ncbi:MAG: GNAT family N-acetyltransferase [Phycisphaerales bacterium]|nr:GNAT family N-acetyltransferase [Phycisphaerales bacterium]